MAEILTKSIRVKNRYGYSPDPYSTGALQSQNKVKVPVDLRIDIYDAGKNKRIIKVPTGAGWLTQEWVERTYKKSDLNDIGIDIDNDDDIIFLYLTSLINTGLGNTSPLLRDLPCFAEVDTFYYNNKPVLDIDKRFINFFRDKIHPITKDFTVNSKTYNVLPFCEIVEDPWTNNYDPQNITRDFGDVIGRYTLNNNTEVVIKWRSPNSNQVYTTSNHIIYGKDYSDNWGREIIDRTDPSGDPILTNPEKAPETPWLFERTIIMRPPSDSSDSESFTMKKDGTFAAQRDVNAGEEKIWQLSSTDPDRGFKISKTGDEILEPDVAILQEVVEFWKRVPGNESLDICYNLVNDTKVYLTLYDGYKKPFIDYISPISSTGPSASEEEIGLTGTTGASGASASGSSQSSIIDLYQPKELVFNTEKEGYLINTEYGEFKLVPQEDLFVFGDDDGFNDGDLLQGELESTFAGEEEAAEIFTVESVDTEKLNSIKGDDPENPNESLSTNSDSKYPVSKDTDANIKAIIKAAKDGGITNKYAIAAMLAICKKESGFIPRNESSYSGTAASRIKKIFSKFRSYSDSEVDTIKKDHKRFFDIIYGGKYGNSNSEGYKYRGRGFNQLTFKGNYQKYKELTGVDIVYDPDLLNTVPVAAKCLVAYFTRNFSSSSARRKDYNFTDINSFKNLDDAVGAFYHANAGWGKSVSEVKADSAGGRAKSFKYAGPLYNTYLS